MQLFLLYAAAALAPAPPAAATTPPPSPAAPAAPAQPQIVITGETLANGPLAWDAMQEVVRFSNHHLKCAMPTKVDAQVMPEGWLPRRLEFRIGPPGARYERWNVHMCARVEPFLIAFWTPPGKTEPEFAVGHPFKEPADPRAKG